MFIFPSLIGPYGQELQRGLLLQYILRQGCIISVRLWKPGACVLYRADRNRDRINVWGTILKIIREEN